MFMKDLLNRRLFHACCGCVLISLFLMYIYSSISTAPNEEKQLLLLQNTPGHQIHLQFHQNKVYDPGSSKKYSGRNDDQGKSATGTDFPPLEMELARRHATQISADMLLFVSYHLKILQDSLKENGTHKELFKKQEDLLKYILSNLVEYQSVMEDQVKVLADNDGWSSWRKAEAEDLQETMKRRLYALQNPSNCSQAPVLLCDLKSTSGFGSGLHDILWCFIKAYYLNMRMVLITSSWHYAPGGWETLFKPVSDNCSNNEGIVAATGPGGNNNKDRGLLRVLPSDLGPRIIHVHSSPLAWWYGQFFGYLMRPNDKLKAFLEDFKTKINFNKPIIGIHVRRTDKVKEEAKGHSLEEYMQHVDNYFVGQELKELQVQRKIYLATDDPTVIQECHDKFKKYICISNSQAALTASNMATRYSNSSLWGVLADIFMLANTDYLVCTFSSNLCRLAYELRHALQLEGASDRVRSLDVQYYFANVSPPLRCAIYGHVAKNSEEITFSRSNTFEKPNEWSILFEAKGGKVANGFSKYNCKQSGKTGLLPTFKTKEVYELVSGENIKYNSATGDISFRQHLYAQL